MNIAYDARPLQPETRHWGPGVVIQNILERLSDDFQFVGIAHRFQSGGDWLIRRWPAIPRTQRIFFELSPLFAGRFDVYWGTNHYIPQTVKRPSVVTVHDLLILNNMDGERALRFIGWRFSSALRRANRVITVSNTTASDLLARFPELKGKVEVALLGFALPSPTVKEDTVREGSSDAPYVLMLGAHRPRKNLGLALAAIARLIDQGIRIRLLITGDIHPVFEGLLRHRPDNARALGVLPREKLLGLLLGATALFFPSRYEGFGFPLLEAMAAGCPVLALDTPINREIAAGAAILLPDDPGEWAKTCKLLLSSPSMKGEVRARGFENLARFSWDRTAATYGQVFRSVGL